MNQRLLALLRQGGAVLYQAVLRFPDGVRVGVTFLPSLLIAVAAVAATYIALRAIWVAVHIALRVLGIEGG